MNKWNIDTEFAVFEFRHLFAFFHRSYNVRSVQGFSNLSDSDLDDLVRTHVEGNDNIGANAMRAKLFGQGIKVDV